MRKKRGGSFTSWFMELFRTRKKRVKVCQDSTLRTLTDEYAKCKSQHKYFPAIWCRSIKNRKLKCEEAQNYDDAETKRAYKLLDSSSH